MEKCQCLRLLCPDAADSLVYRNMSVVQLVLTSTKGNPQLFTAVQNNVLHWIP